MSYDRGITVNVLCKIIDYLTCGILLKRNIKVTFNHEQYNSGNIKLSLMVRIIRTHLKDILKLEHLPTYSNVKLDNCYRKIQKMDSFDMIYELIYFFMDIVNNESKPNTIKIYHLIKKFYKSKRHKMPLDIEMWKHMTWSILALSTNYKYTDSYLFIKKRIEDIRKTINVVKEISKSKSSYVTSARILIANINNYIDQLELYMKPRYERIIKWQKINIEGTKSCLTEELYNELVEIIKMWNDVCLNHELTEEQRYKVQRKMKIRFDCWKNKDIFEGNEVLKKIKNMFEEKYDQLLNITVKELDSRKLKGKNKGIFAQDPNIVDEPIISTSTMTNAIITHINDNPTNNIGEDSNRVILTKGGSHILRIESYELFTTIFVKYEKLDHNTIVKSSSVIKHEKDDIEAVAVNATLTHINGKTIGDVKTVDYIVLETPGEYTIRIRSNEPFITIKLRVGKKSFFDRLLNAAYGKTNIKN